jgi:putative sporulation protein YyaC
MEDKDKFYSADIINNLIEYYLNSYKEEIIIICIGTPKSVGDSLGPLIGTKLSELVHDIPIYGTFDFPVHAVNLDFKLDNIYSKHPNAFIIGIDAAIGHKDDIGKTRFRNFPIKPGKGIGRDLQPVGDVSIIGIIVDSSKDDDDIINDMDLISPKLLVDISKQIVEALYEFCSRITIAQEIAATI